MSAVPQPLESWRLGKLCSRSERISGPRDVAHAQRQCEERHGEHQCNHECRSVRARGLHGEPVEESSNDYRTERRGQATVTTPAGASEGCHKPYCQYPIDEQEERHDCLPRKLSKAWGLATIVAAFSATVKLWRALIIHHGEQRPL